MAKFATKKNLILNRPWAGPQGIPLALYEPSFRSRRNRYPLPDDNAGGLAASISTKSEANDPPSSLDAFFVGASMDNYPVRKTGSLWITVNDVQYHDQKHPELSSLFYNDSVGLFWARATIKRAESTSFLSRRLKGRSAGT